ncbi:metal-binding protein ZinT [Ornithinibacillus sp. BX22]|uniref:Metal-binding protein ZinT n=1 Tax=Ornithinibacillus hominis TaxID=2763055 RepID=A0A923RIM2_9BACI|nr:metal-binding protein ZinT [Ornithinibacillus hominis]MBC5637309.1 metal-binding protein ZinT [Ornithinibacillus hominis]
MKVILLKGLGALVLIMILVGCQDSSSNEKEPINSKDEVPSESNKDATEINVTIDGLADHYHTGSTIQLTATTDKEVDHPHWHWFTLDPGASEWEVIEGQTTEKYEGEAKLDGVQLKAVLYDDNHEVLGESEPVTITIDDHHGLGHDEEAKKIYAGYFEDSQIKDRTLSDWEGDWQSVYPYLLDGTLDEVFAHKAEEDDSKTVEEYKEYYDRGYKTDVNRIVIEEDIVTFYENGNEYSGKFTYDGYEILEYDAGNRGVRYIFKHEDGVEGVPTYIQFSDHSIYPTDSYHFHLYWGDDRDVLLNELDHWPTYYPSELDGDGIVTEMIAH